MPRNEEFFYSLEVFLNNKVFHLQSALHQKQQAPPNSKSTTPKRQSRITLQPSASSLWIASIYKNYSWNEQYFPSHHNKLFTTISWFPTSVLFKTTSGTATTSTDCKTSIGFHSQQGFAPQLTGALQQPTGLPPQQPLGLLAWFPRTTGTPSSTKKSRYACRSSVLMSNGFY